MDRLTARKGGLAYYTACFADDAPCGGGNPGEQCLRCDQMEKQCQRLAAYEDTGLTPEAITRMKSATERQAETIRQLEKANADQAQKLQRARGIIDTYRREAEAAGKPKEV